MAFRFGSATGGPSSSIRFGSQTFQSWAASLVSAAINSAGDELTLTFTGAITPGAGGAGGVTLAASGGAVTATYASGSGTTALVYSLSRTIEQGETVTTGYTQPGDGLEDGDGVDVASYSGAAVTNNSTADLTAPTLVSSTINAAGTQLTQVFGEAVDFGAGGSGGFSLDGTDAPTLAYASGRNTTTVVWNLSRTVREGEGFTLDYAPPANGWADGADNALAAITGAAVTNDSEVVPAISNGPFTVGHTVTITLNVSNKAGPASTTAATYGGIPTGISSQDGSSVDITIPDPFENGLRFGATHLITIIEDGRILSTSNVLQAPADVFAYGEITAYEQMPVGPVVGVPDQRGSIYWTEPADAAQVRNGDYALVRDPNSITDLVVDITTGHLTANALGSIELLHLDTSNTADGPDGTWSPVRLVEIRQANQTFDETVTLTVEASAEAAPLLAIDADIALEMELGVTALAAVTADAAFEASASAGVIGGAGDLQSGSVTLQSRAGATFEAETVAADEVSIAVESGFSVSAAAIADGAVLIEAEAGSFAGFQDQIERELTLPAEVSVTMVPGQVIEESVTLTVGAAFHAFDADVPTQAGTPVLIDRSKVIRLSRK